MSICVYNVQEQYRSTNQAICKTEKDVIFKDPMKTSLDMILNKFLIYVKFRPYDNYFMSRK